MPIAFLLFGTALLYSAVGHAGTSGCVAAMALFGFTPAVMKPVALAANLVVGMIAIWQLYVAGGVSLRRILPIVLSSIPFALLGGALTLPDVTYHVVVGVLFLFAVLQLFATQRRRSPSRPLPLLLLVVCTMGISFLAGLTGIGSGILLSPLLVFAGETNTRQAAGVLAAFIFTTALTGLIGYAGSERREDYPALLNCCTTGPFDKALERR